MKLLTGILLLNLVVLSLAQYDFFDNYVKNFLKNVFSGGRGRTPSATSGRDVPDLRPQVCDCSFRNGNYPDRCSNLAKTFVVVSQLTSL